MKPLPDLEALLVALVLLPGTYSRNRFFELYTDPAARDVRKRAQLVRSIILAVTSADEARRGRILAMNEEPEGRVTLTYVVSSINLKRTTALTALEVSLVRYALARRAGPFEPLPASGPDRQRIESALGRLGPALPETAPDEDTKENGLPSA
ncbi:hypothetical protein [Polyangium aurulentum]|uniref:hypothetical protein n=1 Tax=Polyangium aurulentum TaxID=2567896 RepID=UPI0010AE5CCF|nr:hypothetical protein [Polyangium aurulentum]UQA60898.1 hypothetical protein E8A73_010610 [Polyangium aurulentum]